MLDLIIALVAACGFAFVIYRIVRASDDLRAIRNILLVVHDEKIDVETKQHIRKHS